MNEFETFSTNPSEQPEISKSEANRRLGATVLTNVGFNARNKEIVDSSFNKARKNNEKLPGKNDERRNYAYLSRLENLVDKYGNDLEKRLWQNSINDDLLIKYDNVTDSYWDSKRQELRDNGYGNIELTDSYKHELFNMERELQEKSLQKWANYLGDEHSPYPLWFKVYAWDGMTKMGRYNKTKSKYEVRNETTVAPYPEPDAEVLGKVFETVNHYYGNSDKKFYTEEGERNVKLEQIVQSGNFSKIYNAVQQEIAPIIQPPEKAEDVHGGWVEYKLGDEDDIARAAMGTGWCVASSSVGRHYLKYGSYGHDENDWDDEYDEYDDEYDDEYNDEYNDEYGEPESNKAKFILFHLEDQNTGKLTKNAVASIRLDPNGQVAEISGLKDGQALNDSLVSIVEEKVKSLPGGVEFLPKFADKNELRRLDRDKMEKGEPLTKEEYEFIYEINRPINTLDTYNTYDPRVYELRKAYGIESALDAGVDVNKLVSKLNSENIDRNLDTLLNHGADINQLVSKIGPSIIAGNLDTLLAHGANIDINQLVSEFNSWGIANNLDTLLSHGADINQIVSELYPSDTAKNLDTLISHGANIDINQLLSELSPDYIADKLDTLLNHGAGIDQLVSKLYPGDIAKNLDALLNHGADINQLVSELYPSTVAYNLDALLSHGADINQLVSKLDSWNIANNLDTLLSHGANIDINQLLSGLSPDGIADNLDALLNHGAGIDQLVSKLYPGDIAKNFDALLAHGANIDINQLVSRLDPDDIVDNLDAFISHGANIDINQLVSKLEPYDIVKNLDTLLSHGANIDVNELVSKLYSDYIANNLDALLSHGADINQLVSRLEPWNIANNLDTLISHGANIDIDQLVSKLYPDDIAKNLDTLISHGADINRIISRLTPYYIAIYRDILRAHGANV